MVQDDPKVIPIAERRAAARAAAEKSSGGGFTAPYTDLSAMARRVAGAMARLKPSVEERELPRREALVAVPGRDAEEAQCIAAMLTGCPELMELLCEGISHLTAAVTSGQTLIAELQELVVRLADDADRAEAELAAERAKKPTPRSPG